MMFSVGKKTLVGARGRPALVTGVLQPAKKSGSMKRSGRAGRARSTPCQMKIDEATSWTVHGCDLMWRRLRGSDTKSPLTHWPSPSKWRPWKGQRRQPSSMRPPTPRWAPKCGQWASSTTTLPLASRKATSSLPMKVNLVILPATTLTERRGENQSWAYWGGGRM